MGIGRAIAYIARDDASPTRTALMPGRRLLTFAIAGFLSALLGAAELPIAGAEGYDHTYDPWPGLVQDIFNNRPMNDGSDIIGIEMPYRAEDAAIVPVTLRSKLAPDDGRRFKAIPLVI